VSAISRMELDGDSGIHKYNARWFEGNYSQGVILFLNLRCIIIKITFKHVASPIQIEQFSFNSCKKICTLGYLIFSYLFFFSSYF